MYSFQNDYAEGAHPTILQKLFATNEIQQDGYGEDEYSLQAKSIIKQKINRPDAEVYFVPGGTQANMLVIGSLLRPHEAVISAETGHILGHEAGAIESVGHKVIAAPTPDGKLTASLVKRVLKDYQMRPHVVKPRLVYISNSTEIGSLYGKSELAALYRFCRENKLLLFMDGARLGAALTAKNNPLSLGDCAKFTDVFYIGGTKNGALLGEAIVFNRPDLMPEFDYNIKQKGALLAKGRLLGIQFLTLFEGDLFFELATHAHQMAEKLAAGITDLGFGFLMPPESNQLFPVLPNTVIKSLEKDFKFHRWQEVNETETAIRLVTSWTTQPHAIDDFLDSLKKN